MTEQQKKKQKKQKKQKKHMQQPCVTTTTCVICLEAIKAEDGRYDLECGHTFHNGCITNWYKSKAGGRHFLHMPYQDMKHLLFFSNGTNCFCCPTCRVEYTKEMEVTDKCNVRQKDTTVKKILGKINILDFNARGGFTVATHYVTDLKTFQHFEPMMEMDDEEGNSTITLYKRK